MRANNISIRHLRAFCAVADLGSFTHAASHLHLTQSTLTSTIKQLEQTTEVQLFDRTTRQVKLTVMGEQFYPVATKLLSDFDTALTDLHAMSKQAIGNISLAASPSMLSCVLPSLVADYQHHHPQVAITLRDQTASGIEKSLLNNEVDLGFGGTQLFHAELEYSPLLSDRYGVVVSRDHPFAQTANRSIKWHDMEKERLIILTTDTGIQRQIDHVLLTHEASRLQASTPAAVAALIQSGAGVSILPALAAATDAFRDLIFLPLCEPELSRTLYSIKRAGRALQPTAEGLMKKVHEEAKLTQLPTSIADYILFQEECLSGKEIPPS